MSALRYKTRAGSAPQGKPRVYFCCHPEDFSLWFEPLSKELLELWDCALWYAEGDPWGDADEEDFADSLAQMQLFVIPISEAFLHEENYARVKEFPLAMERHIPVLPILVNSGLASDFNRICGNIQFLDRTSTDVTEIPYREKLKSFLSSVLVTEELTQKIRAAFDAYVFLSYRKKDRKYAQELMHLIHENEFCRDIAIWYDEFLTPGEDFNASIQEALQKSQLFALAVTPNLVNEKNYVMDIEYPMARQEGKEILAVELRPTDRSLLEQYYADIPRCVDSHDPASLSSSLAESLRDIAIRENDSSPEHLLFIGLAYLGGIDVEVDPARGVELITDAAEDGLPEAMDKLVSLYRTGDGVPLDQDKALLWQDRLVGVREDSFREKGVGGEALLDSLRQLAELCLECQQYPRAAEACQKLWSELDSIAERLNRETARVNTLWYHDKMGTIWREQGLLVQARAEFQTHKQAATQYWEETGTADALYLLMHSCSQLGQLSLTEGNLEQAQAHYRKAMELAELADRQLCSVLSMSRRLVVGMEYGYVLLRQKNLACALDTYEGLLPLARRLAEDGSARTMEMLSQCCQCLSDLYSDLGQHQKALDCERQSLSIARQLADQAPSLHNLRRLLGDEIRWGDLLFRLNPPGSPLPPEILEHYTISLSLAQQLVKRTGSPWSWLGLAQVRDRISRFYGAAGDEQKEFDFLTQAVQAAEQAAGSSGGIEAKRALSGYLSRLALLSRENQNEEQARSYRKKSFQLDQEIAEETQAMEDQVAIARDHLAMSVWAQDRGDGKAAMDHLRQAVQLCEKAVELEPSVTQYRRALADCYVAMGRLYLEKGDAKSARLYQQKGLELEESLQKEDTSHLSRWSLAAKYQEQGDSFCSQGDWSKAWPYYQRYLQIYETLAEEESEKEHLQRLRSAWIHCCTSAMRYGYYRQAKEFAFRACSAGQQAFALDQDSIAAYDSLLYSYRCIVELCLLQKELDQADHYAGVCCRMAKRIPQLFPHIHTYGGSTLEEYAGTRIQLVMQIYIERAQDLTGEEEYDLAVDVYEGAIRCAEAFLELFPGNREGRHRLALLHWRCANIWPDGYLPYYLKKARKLWEELAQEFPDDTEYAHNTDVIRKILDS